MMFNQQAGSATRTSIIVILAVCVVLALAVKLLPKGFSDDVSKIGQGKAVVILTHDKNSVQSLNMMELLNNIRGDYTDRVEFMAIDIDSMQGQTFTRQQRVGGIMLLLFDASGVRKTVFDRTVDENQLRMALDGLD